MAKTTPATLALQKAGVAFSVASYDYDGDAASIGLQAAEALGVAPNCVLKTLMAEVDGRPVCAIVPSDAQLSMKKLAAAFSGKAARMLEAVEAERVTGYRVGGISPFGQRRMVPTAIEIEALGRPQVFINGGQRGLQVKLSPADAQRVIGALAASLVAEA